MKFHPFSELFPLLEGADLEALIEDIKAHGLREKIVLYQGKVLDGRNRFLAWQKAKMRGRPPCRQFKGSDAQALALVVSANIRRRHLTEAQRAMAAARIATLTLGDNQHASREAPSQAAAAESLDVSRSSVQRARKVIEDGSKALQHAVESGEVPLKRAAEVTALPKSEQLAAAKEKPSPAPEPDLMPEPEISAEEVAEIDAQVERERTEIAEKVLAADDRLAAADAEVRRLARELLTMTRHRDHWLNQAGANAKFAKGLQRTITALEKKLERANAEIDKLRERVAVMETA